MPLIAAIPSKPRRPRWMEAPSGTSLLALFILSPTAGTVVVAWRGVKLLIARHRERRALEGRALGLRHRPYVQTCHPCPSCGFGVLRMLGDTAMLGTRPRSSQPSRPHPLDLRCDRPGCHHLAPHTGVPEPA